MLKTFSTALSLCLLGIVSLGNCFAQQTTAPTSKAPATKSPSTKTPATGTQTKSHHTAAAKSSKPLALTTQKAKFSYALGMNLGSSLHHDEVEVDPDILAQGLKDALAGGKMQLTEDQAKAAMMETQNQVRTKMQAKMQAEAAANKKDGDAFLAANKGKEGVVALPSGLQYKVLKQGTGPKPAATDSVVCNYRGTLINGKEFDSSYKRGEPATFPVNGVIKGWTEALQQMPVGSKWRLFVPSDLAYGERGAGEDIGPNSTLIFEVELLSIQNKADNKSEDKDKKQ
jgi:FKBP-type peptidyl-prolyl cis-trans isomerase FklB